ncbi:hypothetical protein CTAYLR_006992 [Chrysophaeum taylorii]|uniref:Uncharacterized protein n=1 Tax=Chrysophaeum taylorii TaxID=2483200 RepID=A0AAD7UBF3_9STRA|nr:hypothetical protein CTAYLR_006992 [Chrysophaeum taylorii]
MGEMEALSELFFDNLASLLSITGLILGFFLNVLIFNAATDVVGDSDPDFEYAETIKRVYTTYYYERVIPGVGFALLFGNFYYAYMAGRLAHKEKRADVTAQPYGINTTGAFITLGAINLTALFNELYKEKNLDKGFGGDWRGAGQDVAEEAWKVAVSATFVTGCMEVAGCFLGEFIRKVFPSPAIYSCLTGVGFTYLFFSPMLDIAAEPIMCYLSLLVVLVGFFGNAVYRIGNTGLTFPIALCSILLSVAFGWLGGCRHKNDAIGMYDYGDGTPGSKNYYYDTKRYRTCTGTAAHDAQYAYREYAGELGSFGSGIFDGLDALTDTRAYVSTAIVVGVVSFAGTMSCVESASAAGDDYPMAETMIIDGIGTCIGACFGSYYSTTVYIGHPIHKQLGARRGYSLINGMIYFVLLMSGLFASLYQTIPGCANGALLVFVGLLICRQAVEDNPPRYWPAIFFGLFPTLCNWAKLYIDPGNATLNGEQPSWYDSADAGNWGSTGVGIEMVGQGGGLWATLFFTAIFCYCIDRKFRSAAFLSACMCVLQAALSIPILFNAETAPGKGPDSHPPYMGPEKVGAYPKKPHDANFSWMWSVTFAMATVFFLIHYGMQKIGYIDPPIDTAAEVKGTPVETTGSVASLKELEFTDKAVPAEEDAESKA